MKTEEKFETLCSRIMDMDAAALPSVDFLTLCREMGADEREMDNRMYATFGMSGDEIMEEFRKRASGGLKIRE